MHGSYRGEDAAPLPAPVPDPEVVSAALGADLKAAYDGVLAEFKKSGNSEASRALLKPALEMNSRSVAGNIYHRRYIYSSGVYKLENIFKIKK